MRASLVVAAVSAVFACASCAADDERAARDEDLGVVRSPVIKGEESPASQDSVVLIKHYDAVKIGGGAEGCTGVMIAPRLVLTARHCVAATETQLACGSDGKPTFGGGVTGNYPASKLFAFSGPDRPDFLSSLDRAARGAEIIDDGADNLCNHDVALILLETALPGAHISPVRLEGGPQKDEVLTLVGWGVTEKGPDPAKRQQRTGVGVLAVGPADSIGPSEFMTGESGCAGDSGGPVFAASGAVVGLLSRGGNGSGAPAGDPASCMDGERPARNMYSSTAAFRTMLLAAYAKAGQEAWPEGGVDPRLPKAEAPAAKEDDGGCAIAPAALARASRESTSTMAVTFAAIAAVFACMRRRRSPSSPR